MSDLDRAEQLAAIRERHELATPGAWHRPPDCDRDDVLYRATRLSWAKHEFADHAHEDVGVLLAAHDALVARVLALTDAGNTLDDALEDTSCPETGDGHADGPHMPYCSHGQALAAWRALVDTAPTANVPPDPARIAQEPSGDGAQTNVARGVQEPVVDVWITDRTITPGVLDAILAAYPGVTGGTELWGRPLPRRLGFHHCTFVAPDYEARP